MAKAEPNQGAGEEDTWLTFEAYTCTAPDGRRTRAKKVPFLMRILQPAVKCFAWALTEAQDNKWLQARDDDRLAAEYAWLPRGENPFMRRSVPATELPIPKGFALLDIQAVAAHVPYKYLHIRRVTAKAPNGSDVYYEVLERQPLDAAVLCAYFDHAGVRHVVLRETPRVPLLLRDETRQDGVLWEVCAGLIESGETPAQAAVREGLEELGVRIAESDLQTLGATAYPAPGFIAERHFFYAAKIDPTQMTPPAGDGSALEDDASIVSVPLTVALRAAREGRLPDAKSELALRRLTELP